MKPEDNESKTTRFCGMVALVALGITLAFASYSSLAPQVNAQFGGSRGFGGEGSQLRL